MRQLQDYIGTPFMHKGRDYPNFDCWGLARDARAHLFGGRELPAFSHIAPSEKKALTKATREIVLHGFVKESAPVAGALATAWFGGLCVHIGIVVSVDGRMWVLDTEEGHGGRLNRIQDFEQLYDRVIYYVET